MNYNLSFMNTSNNLYDIAYNVNDLTSDLFGVAILTGIFILVFTKSLNRGTSTAFMIASFTSGIIGALFMFIGFVTWQIVSILFVLFLISVVVKFFQD